MISDSNYYNEVKKGIKAVIWKVNEKYRNDVASELMKHALINKSELIKHNKNYLFVALRNKCTDLNQKEIRYRSRMIDIGDLPFETESFADELSFIDIQDMLSAAFESTKLMDKTLLSIIMQVIQKIQENEKYPVKAVQKDLKMRSSKIYKLIRRIRRNYGQIKKNGQRILSKVRSLEEFKKQLHTRQG